MADGISGGVAHKVVLSGRKRELSEQKGRRWLILFTSSLNRNLPIAASHPSDRRGAPCLLENHNTVFGEDPEVLRERPAAGRS